MMEEQSSLSPLLAAINEDDTTIITKKNEMSNTVSCIVDYRGDRVQQQRRKRQRQRPRCHSCGRIPSTLSSPTTHDDKASWDELETTDNDTNLRPTVVAQLKNLTQLFEEGFLTATEFKARRIQLVDTYTGTIEKFSRHRLGRSSSWCAQFLEPSCSIVVKPHPPPEFSSMPQVQYELATKHEFNYKLRSWSTCEIRVKIDTEPFARGGLRVVYHCIEESNNTKCLVAKRSIDAHEDEATYFRDVEMQAVAAEFATVYNAYHPPRPVEFLPAWIITTDTCIFGVEPFISGDYQKHNNNFGFVNDERNTPQAFSHFSYEASNHELLIVDIQGVADIFTDPQIHHSNTRSAFGKGNLSNAGVQKFLKTHRCNEICRFMKLPLINPKDDFYSNTNLTLPASTFMAQENVSNSFDNDNNKSSKSIVSDDRRSHGVMMLCGINCSIM